MTGGLGFVSCCGFSVNSEPSIPSGNDSDGSMDVNNTDDTSFVRLDRRCFFG